MNSAISQFRCNSPRCRAWLWRERVLKSSSGSVVDTEKALIDGILNDKQYPACYHLTRVMARDKGHTRKSHHLYKT